MLKNSSKLGLLVIKKKHIEVGIPTITFQIIKTGFILLKLCRVLS
jgi:hypothetical protein